MWLKRDTKKKYDISESKRALDVSALSQKIVAFLVNHASEFGVTLALISIVPLISLGYLSLLWFASIFFSETGFSFVPQFSDLIALEQFPALILSVMLFIVTVLSKRWLLVLVFFNLFLLWLLSKSNGGDLSLVGTDSSNQLDTRTAIVLFSYILAAAFTIFLILSRGPLSYPLNVLFIVLIFAESFGVLFGIHLSFFSFIFTNYSISPINSVTVVFLALLIRGGVKFLEENKEDYQSLTQEQKKLGRKETVRHWWPALVIFGVFTFGNFAIQQWVIKPAVIESLDKERLGSDEYLFLSLQPRTDSPSDSIPEDMKSATISEAINRIFDKNKDSLDSEIEKIGTDVNTRTQASADQIEPYVRSKIPQRFPGTETRGCRWYDVGCHIKNGIKSMINSGYVSAKESFLGGLKSELKNTSDEIKAQRKAAEVFLKAKNSAFTDASKRKMIQSSTALTQISIMMTVYALLILGKSYLIVYARVFYSRNSIGRPEEGSEVRNLVGVVGAQGNAYDLPSSRENGSYFVFDVIGENTIDRRRIPQPFSIALSRIFRGKYVLNRVEAPKNSNVSGGKIKVDKPREIILWKLRDGEEIILNIRDLIGFSETCTLGRKVSMHLSSLVFGRIIYHYIQGPGEIYLLSESSPIVGNDKDANSVMHSTSLLAWGSQAQFFVRSSLTKFDVFFSGYSIEKVPLKKFSVAYDTSQERRKRTGRGIWRLMLTFLLPV